MALLVPGPRHRYDLQETDKGVSIIATAEIPRRMIIMEEKPLFIMERKELLPKKLPKKFKDGTMVDGKVFKAGPPWQIVVQEKRQQLSRIHRAVYDDLAYSPNILSAADRKKIPLRSDLMMKTSMRFRTNAMECGSGTGDQGIFPTCSRLNHSCMPNAQFT
ncbi:hypothetical protein PG996_010574 [Apiospora saccharicola]|uniref:SET domain-containing protein n=1 Tax=Apiospora saccharicola TaxID=335842 RepID=A0ABR1UP10_9PEZI